MPAPTAAITRLLGKACCRSRKSRGPRTHAATNPDTPADMWMTNPPEKSTAPSWAKYPPPQSRKASMAYTNVDHNAAEEQQRRDGREDELEEGEGHRREVERDDGVGGGDRRGLLVVGVGYLARLADEVVPEVPPPADPGELGLDPVPHAVPERGPAEAHLVGPQDPGHEHERKAREHHRQHVHRPLLLDDRRIEDSQSRKAHQPDERGGHDLPRVVRRVQPAGIRDLNCRSKQVLVHDSSAPSSPPSLPGALRIPAARTRERVRQGRPGRSPSGSRMPAERFRAVTRVLPVDERPRASTGPPDRGRTAAPAPATISRSASSPSLPCAVPAWRSTTGAPGGWSQQRASSRCWRRPVSSTPRERTRTPRSRRCATTAWVSRSPSPDAWASSGAAAATPPATRAPARSCSAADATRWCSLTAPCTRRGTRSRRSPSGPTRGSSRHPTRWRRLRCRGRCSCCPPSCSWRAG